MSDPTRILVAGRARVYLAPLGTIAPVDESVALGSAWLEVGLTDPDTLTIEENPTFGTVNSHQSDYVTRTFQTADAASVAVDLQEFSAQNLKAVFGGGTLTVVTTGHYRWAPPQVGGRSNVACIAQVTDGTKQYRYVIPNCMEDSGVAMKLSKKTEVALPLRLTVMGADGVDAWYLLTNDPAFATMV